MTIDPIQSEGKLIRLKRQSEPWMSRLIMTREKRYSSCEANVRTILQSDPAWEGVLGRSLFHHANTVFLKTPPSPFPPRSIGQEWTDGDDILMQQYIATKYDATPPRVAAVRIAVSSADLPEHHPVREYLSGVTWDGVPRIANWLETYGQATGPAQRLCGRWWLISAVARAFQPGCQVHTVLILESPEQGIGKSTLVSTMAVKKEWFADELADLGSKDAAQQLSGRWIIELGELSCMSRADQERAKSFFVRSDDRYRPSYGVRVGIYPRHCVFAGTTNSTAYLRDDTGNRRYWPVRVKAIDLDAVARDRGQLWAEAVTEYREGKSWWPTTPEERRILHTNAEERREIDVWYSIVAAYLADSEETTLHDVMEDSLKIDKAQMDKSKQMRVASILNMLGFTSSGRVRKSGKREVRWIRTPGTPLPWAHPQEEVCPGGVPGLSYE